MKRLVFVLGVVALAGCARQDDTAAMDTSAMAMPPAPVKLSDAAGTWTVKGMNQAGDSTLITYDLVATPDTTGWMINFASGAKVPLRVVTVAGDSIVTEAGPFKSQLRKGVNVRTSGAFRIQDGKLVGTTVARYETKRPDSVVIIMMEGTRKP